MTTRREFLRTLGAVGALAASPGLAGEGPESDALGPLLPTRVLGRTGVRVTALCQGGHHMETAGDEKASQAVIETAIGQGVRFFDSARSYGKGRADVLYGKLLTPKYRDQVFLMSKSGGKNRAAATQDLESSLRDMKTDHLDLWQIHAIESPADVDNRIRDGVLDTFLEERAKGRVRHIGFTGHSSQAAHLHMLAQLKERGLDLDTCQMPMNLVDPHYDSFITHVLPVLIERKYGIMAMKTLVFGRLIGAGTKRIVKPDGGVRSLKEEGLTMADLLGYVLSLPISALVSGCDSADIVRENAGIVRAFKGMTVEQRDALLAKTETYGGAEMEYYKRKS
ncbi:MAG: aldo/keto reductase [Kiritimatiellia bacterium]